MRSVAERDMFLSVALEASVSSVGLRKGGGDVV
jgi:hypothetical protein